MKVQVAVGQARARRAPVSSQTGLVCSPQTGCRCVSSELAWVHRDVMARLGPTGSWAYISLETQPVRHCRVIRTRRKVDPVVARRARLTGLESRCRISWLSAGRRGRTGATFRRHWRVCAWHIRCRSSDGSADAPRRASSFCEPDNTAQHAPAGAPYSTMMTACERDQSATGARTGAYCVFE